jgi:bacteriorhodopsin
MDKNNLTKKFDKFDKLDKIKDAKYLNLVKNSFRLSCLVLVSSTFITLIEALKTENIKARHILNLETAVSFVASYVYSIFTGMVDKDDFSLKNITSYRYMDWVITTPMLLLALLLFTTYLNKDELHLGRYLIVVFLNFGMLLFGYLGETDKINKIVALTLGSLFFIGLILFIWFYYIHGRKILIQKIIFFAFTCVWALYGVAFTFDEKTKNITYNFLDIISKVFFGLFMWIYYGGVMVI